MKRTWLVLVLISALFLTGCSAKAETAQLTGSTNTEAPCYYGACIKSAYASVKDGYFAVLFDITPVEGITDANMAPQFTTPLTIRVESMDGTAYVNQVFTQEDYYCYVGTDVPWAVGQITALCGIGIEMDTDSVYPAVNEHVIITMPEYDDYQIEVEVGDSW